MTGRELAEFIKTHHLEDFNFVVQYRDDGGDYAGRDETLCPEVDERNKEVVL